MIKDLYIKYWLEFACLPIVEFMNGIVKRTEDNTKSWLDRVVVSIGTLFCVLALLITMVVVMCAPVLIVLAALLIVLFSFFSAPILILWTFSLLVAYFIGHFIVIYRREPEELTDETGTTSEDSV